MEKIIIKDAYENNLKHIDLEIPLNAFTCVTGCSGCGKSSLVFDTIYAESQRGFLEGMTGNLYGQKLMSKPKVGSIENLSPALDISQNYYNVNPRSTIGTVTEISYYMRSLFSVVNSDKDNFVPENTFSCNNPKTFCPNCFGLGVETVVSENLLIPDREKHLLEGGILFFKGAPDSKEQNYLKALCDVYNIDIQKKICELSKEELQVLLYSIEKIKYKLTYKTGKKKRTHFVYLQGAVPTIQEKLQNTDGSSSPTIYAKYLEEIPCHICKGTKLIQSVLDYKVNGLNYSEVENLEFIALYNWLINFDFSKISSNKKELVEQIVNSITTKIVALIRLNVGYLSLHRSIPSLSGGERQRVRIATQLNCSLKGITYILDEPCKGLHYRDIVSIVKATRDLIDKGNTVIAIDHNKQYIASADHIIELGPAGGPNGGYVIFSGRNSLTGELNLNFRPRESAYKYATLNNINYRNIKNQDVQIPIGGITCITGVSGSGKSTLASVISHCFSRMTNVNCEKFVGGESIKKVIEVNQSPIGKTPRSTIVSYLEIFDEIRELFAQTPLAEKLKCNASLFSMNVKGGRCECCQGTGLQKIEYNYLPSSYILCPECEGKRYGAKILSVTYKGYNIQQILDTPICDVINLFQDTKKVFSVLSNMMTLGLGYLKLGQMSMNLSGGEAQRIKLAKALGATSRGHNLYILDEPTSGLNAVDVERFESILHTLQKNKETIIIIEHNIEFIARISDYIVDFGVLGGDEGGRIIAQGNPGDVFNTEGCSLYNLASL